MNKLTALIKKLTVLVKYLPIHNTLLVITALSYWNVSQTWCNMAYILIVISWIGHIADYIIKENK